MAQSRRMMLKASIAVSLAIPAAAATPAGDAELIRLCAEFDALERRLQAFDTSNLADPQVEEEWEAFCTMISAQQRPLLDRLCTLPCSTTAGVYALGRTLALYLDKMDMEDTPGGYVDSRLTGALLRGIVGRA